MQRFVLGSRSRHLGRSAAQILCPSSAAPVRSFAAQGYGSNDPALAKGSDQFILGPDGAILREGSGLVLGVSEGTFNLTAASRVSALAVAKHAKRWRGIGVDWGCGGGCLALLCAREEAVSRIVGMDFDMANVELSQRNAAANGLAEKAKFYGGDSFYPFEDEGKAELARLDGGLDFVVGNPPASTGDDGFSFRRRILSEAPPFLKEGAVVLIQALSYYGLPRVKAAGEKASQQWAEQQASSASPAPTANCRYHFLGVAASTPWMELGVGAGSYDMKAQLQMYGDAEEEWGRYYCGPDRRVRDVRIAEDESGQVELEPSNEAGFFDAQAADDQESLCTARQVLDIWESTGLRPLGRWQTYMFEWKTPSV